MRASAGHSEDALAKYDAMLASIGARSGEIGDRQLASHWPHVGTTYRGLVIAGQALQGWDRAVRGARWQAAQATDPAGRSSIIESTRTWFADAAEPIAPIAELPNRRRTPFWKVSERLVQTLEPSGPEPWYSRYAWANLYPVSTDNTDTEWGDSPWGALKEAQDPHVAGLFRAWMHMLDASQVVLLAGPRFWWVPSHDGLSALKPQPRPLIAAGRLDGRRWVVAYHPRYAFHLKYTTETFVELLAGALREEEP